MSWFETASAEHVARVIETSVRLRGPLDIVRTVPRLHGPLDVVCTAPFTYVQAWAAGVYAWREWSHPDALMRRIAEAAQS